MPRTIDEGFRDFLSNLTPTAMESANAKSHRASIEQCLRNNFGLNRFTRIGSFGNGTSISGYSDVDYLACLPIAALTANSTSTLVKVRAALDTRFPATGVTVNCPAVLVPFGTLKSEQTEIVPADYVKDDTFKVYDIADCAGGWMRTAPDGHNAYVQMVDNKLANKVKPLIRFVKAWKYFCNVPISSFYLELRVASYCNTQTSLYYYIDLVSVFRFLHNCSLASMQDPMGVSGYISACGSDARLDEARSKVATALTRAEKAFDAERANKTLEAFNWLDLLFGGQFPAYYY
jgi:hypothetical protein